MDVLDEPSIPAPGERKIRSLAAWALSAIRASSMVLEDLAMDILHFLVKLMRKKQETEVVLCDALKVCRIALHLVSSIDSCLSPQGPSQRADCLS